MALSVAPPMLLQQELVMFVVVKFTPPLSLQQGYSQSRGGEVILLCRSSKRTLRGHFAWDYFPRSLAPSHNGCMHSQGGNSSNGPGIRNLSNGARLCRAGEGLRILILFVYILYII